MPARPAAITLLAVSGLACTGARAQDCIWTFHSSPVKTAPAARGSTALAFDAARSHVALYGGHSDTIGTLADTWAWTGSEWLAHLTSGPGPRSGHAMAFIPTRGRCILFGGSKAGKPDNRTWELDILGWSPLPAVNTVNPSGHIIIHDTTHNRTILFGDFGAAPPTRELDPAGLWLPLSIPGPTPRRDAVAAYDSFRSRIILYGGRASDGSILSDVWEFNGAGGVGSWTLIGNGPGPRCAAAAAYDPVRRRFIVQGGIGSDQAWGLTDTWEFDPAAGTWTKRADDGPGCRIGAAMIFDSTRSEVLHFGGGPFPFGLQSNDWYKFNGAGSRAVLVLQAPAPQTITPGETLTLQGLGQNALTYQWVRNQLNLGNGGAVSGAQSPVLAINPTTSCDGGYYILSMTAGCGFADPGANISTNPACFANCDRSTAAPILNANDFQCFLNSFATGECYANCDRSTEPPTLTANDFACFINAFAAGCS